MISEDRSVISKTQKIALDRPAGCVDAVIGLGSFCEVNTVLYKYNLKYINSPFDGFGIKTWHSVIPILKNRFANYWQLENMTIGKIYQGIHSRFNDSKSKYYKQETTLFKVYCNKYNMVSSHNFILEDNLPDDLKTYPSFRQNLKKLEYIFLRQCEVYNNIRFICKAMSWPDSHDTEVKQEHILELLDTLGELRNGKEFTLALAVPAKCYRAIKTWAVENQIPNLHIASWEITWNAAKCKEWEYLLCGVEIPANSHFRLVHEIIGDPSVDIHDMNCH